MKSDLLLHICCGPCAGRVIMRLLPDYKVTGYFYNPNIEPPSEYMQRIEATRTLCRYYGIRLIEGSYNTKFWHNAVAGLEHWTEGGRRCWRCYRIRVEDTAETAVEENMHYFATTLTANPLKNATVINAAGHKAAEINNLRFIEMNFVYEDRYRPSIARKLDLYHQKYCGCIYSAKI